ncbi:MAG: hypothetical protein ACK5NT_08710 [Pyrinomonadaceae bacterium]
MKKLFLIVITTLLGSMFIFGQKGIDKQTTKIKDQSVNKKNDDSGKTFSWGKDKTKIRARMENPLILNSRYDILTETVLDLIKERKMVIDEASSRFDDGLIVTLPFTFAKGAILTKNELNRYAVVPDSRDVWTRGQYTYTIELRSIDGIKNNVSINAKVEGRAGDGLFSEWSTLPSSGEAEDEFLVELAKRVGISVDEDARKP